MTSKQRNTARKHRKNQLRLRKRRQEALARKR